MLVLAHGSVFGCPKIRFPEVKANRILERVRSGVGERAFSCRPPVVRAGCFTNKLWISGGFTLWADD